MLIGGTREGKGRYTTVLSGANTSKFVAMYCDQRFDLCSTSKLLDAAHFRLRASLYDQ